MKRCVSIFLLICMMFMAISCNTVNDTEEVEDMSDKTVNSEERSQDSETVLEAADITPQNGTFIKWFGRVDNMTDGSVKFDYTASGFEVKFRGSKLFQILFFIPYICSTVAVSLMWRWIFDWEGGILNSVFGTTTKWLEDPKTMTWCIIVAIIWQAPGYGIVMYKAAFSNINNALYEAASIDGANAWQKFRNVTLPGISPTTFFLLQAGIGAGLLTYDLAELIIPNAWGVPGGNESMGLTMMRLVYFLITNSTTTDANGVSYMVSCACVISWLLFVVTGVLSMIMFRQREKSMEQEGSEGMNKKFTVGKMLIYVVLILYTIFLFFPIITVLITSFVPSAEFDD